MLRGQRKKASANFKTTEFQNTQGSIVSGHFFKDYTGYQRLKNLIDYIEVLR